MAAGGLMTMRRYAAILSALACLATATGCRRKAPARFHWESPDFRVKGTYYFQPRAAINNFWSSFDPEECAADFTRLRDDGFNSIILFVPWGTFQPTVNPITYDERSFSDLDHILGLAETSGLKVILRMGTHDHIPHDANGGNWLAATVLSNDREWAGYRDLFREVAKRTQHHSNVLFFFWTFEDAGYSPDTWLHKYPDNATAFRTWLRKRPLSDWNALWNEENASYEAVIPPNQNKDPLNPAKLRSFLEFSDELLVRRLPDACAAAKEGNPHVLVSFQPRPEINWEHDYALQYDLPLCYSFVTTWFAPYQSYLFGDKNTNLNGKRTATYVPRHLHRTENLSHGLPVFVDQFIFRHFGGAAGEGSLQSDQEQVDFISGALPGLLESSLGYSLWNAQDYYLSLLANGLFRGGLEHWEVPSQPGLVRVTRGPEDEKEQVELQPGSYIRQKIGVEGGKEYTLRFQAKSSGSAGVVRVSQEANHQSVESEVPVSSKMGAFHLKIQPTHDSDLTLTLAPAAGGPAVQIKEVLLYPWIDTGGLYDVEGRARVPVRDLFRKINKGSTDRN
jgi:hypothetical protein